jgi:CRISPR-associated endonuclease/helicase Cas3
MRHEWVTLLILNRPEIREWLLPAVVNEEDWHLLSWAIAGHHPAYNRPSPPRLAVEGAGHQIKVLLNHRDFAACLDWLARVFDLGKPPRFDQDESLPLVGPGNVFATVIGPWHRSAAERWSALPPHDPERRLVAAAKNCLIAADVAGSALPREVSDETDRAAWISRAFANRPRPGDLATIWRHRLGNNTLHGFQEEVGASKAPVTFVKAGCGSGKTLAAYLWAAEQHPTRRLYFCYPTTGTATEGYKDYLHAPEGEPSDEDEQRIKDLKARLFHSRADVDCEIILKTGQDEERPDADAVARVESLDAWSTPVVSCTVDTVLGLVQNNRRGLYAWPALAGSAFVFDEIHAYDDRLFGALLRFLEALRGVPVLLMTASLPTAREKALQQLLKRSGREMPVIGGPFALEELPRYHKLQGDPLKVAKEEIANGGKVLWVSNTVGRVTTAADRLKDLNPLIYHSRFKYEDRVRRHEAVVNAFKPERNRGPALACCSQVAELSLDLRGCTLLVTDLAPVPAIIQRLGRLNRDARKGGPTRPFLVISEDTKSFPLDNHLPYTPAELEAARGWLAKLPEDRLSQRTLAAAWEEFDALRRPEFVSSAWLDGGPSSTVLELREASPGITVLMADDIPAVKAGKRLACVVLPMPPAPKHLKWRDWNEFKGIPVAPKGAVIYDPMRGAQWQEASQS